MTIHRNASIETPPCKICNGQTILKFELPQSKSSGHEIPNLPNDCRYYECSNCHFLFTTIFDNHDNRNLYDDNYWNTQDPDWNGRVPEALRLALWAASHSGKNLWENSILDFGCGMGCCIQRGRSLGLNVWGTDIIEPKFGIEYFIADCELRKEQFDIIIACEVFEHLPDPVGILDSLIYSLNPEGFLSFQTAYYDPEHCGRDWWYIGPANGHISLYSPRSFSILAEKLGMQQMSIWNDYSGIQLWKKNRQETNPIHRKKPYSHKQTESLYARINDESIKLLIDDAVKNHLLNSLVINETDKNTLPYLLRSEDNFQLKEDFPNYHYLKELFVDLSAYPSSIKRAVFKYCIESVSIETSSYCNFSCTYCPISLLDRKNTEDRMPRTMFDAIIKDLSSINFDRMIKLNLFNEPLADKDYLIYALREIEKNIPKAEVILTSNGSLLTRSYLDEILSENVHQFGISIHHDGKKWDIDREKEKIRTLLRKLDLNEVGQWEEHDTILIYVIDHSRYNSNNVKYLAFRSEDFLSEKGHGSDRGGALKDGIRLIDFKYEECPAVFSQLNVSHDGSIVPCCVMCSDIEPCKSSVYGKLPIDGDIFTIFSSSKAAEFRKSLFAPRGKGEYLPETCIHCGMHVNDPEEFLSRDDARLRQYYRNHLFPKYR